MELTKGNIISLQTFQTFETNNVIMKPIMKPNMKYYLFHKTTILRPLYLRDINDCFCICSKHTIAQKLKIFR